jgi:PAS domain S-box-containing protein
MQTAKIKTLMMLPMIHQGQSIGLVDVEDSRVERTFSEQEVALAQMLANQAANAIQNARLYQQAQREIAERVRAEQSLRESEDLFRLLFEMAPIGMAITALDGRYLRVNQAFCDTLGYASDELLACSVADISYPEDWAPNLEHRERALKGEAPYFNMEKRYINKDGQLVHALLQATLIFDSQEHPLYFVGQIVDITERVLTEETLRRVEERMRTFLESVDDMVYFQGLDGSLSMLNSANTRITGYSLEEFAVNPQLWQEIFHPDDLKVAEEFFATYPDGMPYFEVEYRIRTKGGEQRWIHSRMVGAKDSFGRYLGYNCIDRDITDRKQTEQALRESEVRFRTLVEQIPNSVTYMADLDETSTTLYISPQIVEILGYTPEEYQADPDIWAKAIHPADYDRVVAELARCHEAGEQFVSEYRIIRKDGEVIWFHDEADIVRDEDNKPLYLLGVNTDVTERKQAEGEREALITELEARNEELERFTYTVSHDLKSPLITIKGFLGFLEQDALKGDAERIQADITRISNAADKMQDLLDELLELSRIGRIVNPPEEVPLTELARETVDLLSGRLTGRGVAVHITPDLPVVYGDRQRLGEVLENLVGNAVKFMGDQPEPLVEIGALQDGQETVIYVRDNGVGIDPRYQDKVFGLFEKLDADSDGSGIGLAIVQRIVVVHGGRIWVESEGIGQGSTFCFTVPQSDESI